jgi:hypothetical protein
MAERARPFRLPLLVGTALCAMLSTVADGVQAQQADIVLTLGGDAPFALACTLVPQERIESHEGVPPMELRFAADGVDCDIRTTGPGRLTIDMRGPGGNRTRTATTGPGSRLALSLR